jgi:DNA primase
VGIAEEDIARVRAATDVVAVISEHVALKRVGRNFSGLCPFHGEKSPSFSVSPEKGTYYCFGCQAKGDVITFVRELEHLDFSSAVEKLATKANITLRYDSEAASKDRIKRTKLLEATAQAAEWYHDRLRTAPDAAPARKYLRSRGYDAEAITRFKIGWAPEGWDTLCKSLHLPADVARDTGLGYTSKIGKLNDFFQSRILFPIFDAQGQPIAFGGRKMPDADGPKYKNSSETKLYSKSRVLYGLNWAKSQIVEKGEVIVCEGYTDVIAFHRSGLPRAVATCGTALADEHFQILKNFARRIVLAYDADAAGQNAAEKFYAWERKYEIDLFVVALPPGEDPAELAQHDPERLAAAVRDAQPFLRFRLERLLAKANLVSLEGRARAFESAVAIVFEHPSAMVREQYLNDVALRCQVSAETVSAVLADPTKYLPGAASGPRSKASTPGRSGRPTGPVRSTRDGRENTFAARPDTPAPRPVPRPAAGPSRPPTSSLNDPPLPGEGRVVANEPPDAPPPDDSHFGPSGDSGWSPGPRTGGFDGGGRSGPPRRGLSPSTSRSGGRASSASLVARAASDKARSAELEVLRWVVADPGRVLAWLDGVLFIDPLLRAAFELAVEEPDLPAAAELVAERGGDPVETEALNVLYRLAVEAPTHEPDDAVSRIVGNATSRAIADLAAASAAGVDDVRVDVSAVGHLKHLHERLLHPEQAVRVEALGLLVPWLVAWGHRQ